jgi:Tfp pilus assembly protein PilX
MRDRSLDLVYTPGSERGFALIAVIIVMVVLGLIGAAALTLTAGDQKVTRLFADANQADGAATAGLEHAVAVFQTNGAFPLDGTINGYSYRVEKQIDIYDIDGDAVADTVRLAGDGTLNDTGNGNPVWILTSKATKGSFQAVQQMRVSHRTLTVNPPGALTANHSVNLSGNITVDGRNYDPSGSTLVDGASTATTGACSENKAAVTLTDPADSVNAKGSTNLFCNTAYSTSTPTACVNEDPSILYHTPEEVLGLEPGDLDNVIQDADTYVAPTDSILGLIYVDGDYGSGAAGGNNLSGTGILIVHNPLYNPRQHDPADPMYDAAIASDSRYAPANLGNINGGNFHGLIIADKIDKIDGTIGITGAIVSLTEIDMTLIGAGTATIKYSCSGLDQAANASALPPERLSWSAD